MKTIESRKKDTGLRGIEKLSGLKATHPIVQAQDCTPLDAAACAAVIAGCTAVCSAAEIDAPACIACMGGSYSTCKDCI